jgi:hypothetical protein
MKPDCNSGQDSEMPDFDVEAFVTELDRMGVKLTAIPLADGKLRVNRWRMLNATEHAREIEDLWSTQIGNDSERIDALAAHLIRTANQDAGARISSRPIRFESPSIAEPNGAECCTEPPAAVSPTLRNGASANRIWMGAQPTSSNVARCGATRMDFVGEMPGISGSLGGYDSCVLRLHQRQSGTPL